MDSTPSLMIPNISFSRADLKPGTKSWYLVQIEVFEALQEYGCFEAVYDEVDLKLHKGICGALEELFDLPSETKMKNTLFKPYIGNSDQNSRMLLYEGMAINDSQILEHLEEFTNIMCQKGNANFCEIIYAFVNRASELEQMVKRMVFEGFNMEKYNNSNMESVNYLLRFNKYNHPTTNETGHGLHTHTDMSLLTILHQTDVNGLEVQKKDGGGIRLTPSTSSFIVMLGAGFMAWSNGRLHSPVHHVKMIRDGNRDGNNTRYSIVLFSYSKGIVQTPEELIDEEHPLLYIPFDHMGLYHFSSTKEGQEAPSRIKAYCGV